MGDICQPFYYDALNIPLHFTRRKALKVLKIQTSEYIDSSGPDKMTIEFITKLIHCCFQKTPVYPCMPPLTVGCLHLLSAC